MLCKGPKKQNKNGEKTSQGNWKLYKTRCSEQPHDAKGQYNSSGWQGSM